MQSRRDGLADDAIIRARAPVHAVISVASEFIIRSVFVRRPHAPVAAWKAGARTLLVAQTTWPVLPTSWERDAAGQLRGRRLRSIGLSAG